MESFAHLRVAPSVRSASGVPESAIQHDRPVWRDDERLAQAGRKTTPTSMPATYCPQCGRMVGTLYGRRITHQVRFNEGWCKGGDPSE